MRCRWRKRPGLPFASENAGCMHACGHDNHIAMLLGAAKILTEVKDELQGNVKLFFQPAEESCHGAEPCIEQGVLDGVDAIFGQHIWDGLDAPYLNVQPGVRDGQLRQLHPDGLRALPPTAARRIWGRCHCRGDCHYNESADHRLPQQQSAQRSGYHHRGRSTAASAGTL